MLTHIHIRNFAIIDELDLDLADGMTALTGETGAGKSIVVDALGLALGDRADSAVVRHGAAKAEISASFDIAALPAARAWLDDNDLEAEDECLLRRVIAHDGRSKIYINGSPSTLQLVRELGNHLVDIHGQHEHQSLLRRDLQRALLDDYAGNDTLRTQVAESYGRWKSLRTRLDSLTLAGDERQARVELLRFQVRELEALKLEADEYEQLSEEHARLAHAGRLLETAEQGYAALYDADEQSLHTLLGHQLHALAEAAGLDPALKEPLELVNSAQIQLREAADALRHYADALDLDPERLAFVDERLGLIHDLARKHRVRPEELGAHYQRLAEELAELDGQGYDIEALERDLASAESAYREAAEKLRASRIKAARELNKGVTEAMQGLGMEGGHFEIAVSPDEERYAAHGLDEVEFQVSANPGQPIQALAKVASGGELSRISLAIQMIAARSVTVPTLIYDEVDTGIGGAVAEVVGRQLRRLGKDRQVLCVTHLPQVAAQAHHHLQVAKRKGRDSTQTRIETLRDSRRIEEIARMLGGVELTAQTLAHAEEMIQRASAG